MKRYDSTPDPKPSGKFLFFQPSLLLEQLYLPTWGVLSFVQFIYGITYLPERLLITPLTSDWAIRIMLALSAMATLLALNCYWAYEGNMFRWRERPNIWFNQGKGKFITYFFLIMFAWMTALAVNFTMVIPHTLVAIGGTSGLHELTLVQHREPDDPRIGRGCPYPISVASPDLDFKYILSLCLPSRKITAQVSNGDTLIVEGKANRIGMVVYRLVAVREAQSGIERSIESMLRQ